MPRPDLSPRALALGDKLLARLDLHTPRTMDDLLPWWERQGVLRVELVRLLRQLVEEGQVSRGPDGFLRADPSAAPPPEPPRPAVPAVRPPPIVAREVSRPAPPPEPRPSTKTPVPARAAEEPAARPASSPRQPAPEPAREAPRSSPREPVAKAKEPAPPAPRASAPVEARPSSRPGAKETPSAPPPAARPPVKEPARSAAPASKAPPASVKPAAKKGARGDSDPPPVSRSEPDASSLVGKVLIELRREPQTCATMITKFPGTNGNTVRGALARLKASGLARLDEEGIYHPAQ